MKVAILVDGGFYRARVSNLVGFKSAEERANELYDYCMCHINHGVGKTKNEDELYRIFYYDCPPMKRSVYHPLTKKDITFNDNWTNTFFSHLITKRKLALRKGRLAEAQATFSIYEEPLKELCSGTKTIGNLTEKDFFINVRQKGVDMRIGLDIASLAYKKQVDQIVLIAGDSDFVPAAKLARREGIDFVLDSLGNYISNDLKEHIDGFKSYHYEFFKKNPHVKKRL